MIRELQAGERISESWLAWLVREVRRNRPVAGPGLAARVTPGGTVLRAAAGARGARVGSNATGAWAIRSWDAESRTLKLGDCCYRRSTGFLLLDDLGVTLPGGKSTVCADVTLADGECALRAYPSPETAGGDYTSGKAHVPLYTVDVDADEGGLTVLHDWRGAPELLQYV